MHEFKVVTAKPLSGALRYSRADRAFAFRLRDRGELESLVGRGGVTSLVADTLQLEVAVETGRALFVWGYWPAESWRPERLELPDSVGGRVTVAVDGPPLEEGVSVAITGTGWETLFDQEAGLVRVVRDRQLVEKVVEIADGVHLGLSGAALNSFWLAPEITD
ncbi:hypothetical protein [Amycolatopsis methanolica]|uniref:hypothetical protein n=1 Tax=Amycolatopsis methanolica TaxID=1814 RepID=UPI00342DA7B1